MEPNWSRAFQGEGQALQAPPRADGSSLRLCQPERSQASHRSLQGEHQGWQRQRCAFTPDSPARHSQQRNQDLREQPRFPHPQQQIQTGQRPHRGAQSQDGETQGRQGRGQG